MVYKMNESIIVIQAEATSPNRTNVVFWSHDRGTAKLRMKLVRKNGIPQSLPEGTTVPIRLMFKSATAEGGYGKHDYLATIEDRVNGIVSIVLEDNILGYVGTVEGSVYIDFPNDRSLDTAGRFTFDIKRSPIDDSTPELEDYYFNGFSQTIDKVEKILADGKQEIEQKITESETQIDTKLKDTNDKITKANQDVTTINTNIDKANDRIDQTNQQIAAVLSDVNKYNISKVNDRIDQTNQEIAAVLSDVNEFRTDIDTLKINKADKAFVDAQLGGILNKSAITLTHMFADDTARDAYFVANPSELVELQFIKVGTGYQQYFSGAWQAASPVVAEQVSASNQPIVDTGNYFGTDNTNAALQKLGANDKRLKDVSKFLKLDENTPKFVQKLGVYCGSSGYITSASHDSYELTVTNETTLYFDSYDMQYTSLCVFTSGVVGGSGYTRYRYISAGENTLPYVGNKVTIPPNSVIVVSVSKAHGNFGLMENGDILGFYLASDIKLNTEQLAQIETETKKYQLTYADNSLTVTGNGVDCVFNDLTFTSQHGLFELQNLTYNGDIIFGTNNDYIGPVRVNGGSIKGAKHDGETTDSVTISTNNGILTNGQSTVCDTFTIFVRSHIGDEFSRLSTYTFNGKSLVTNSLITTLKALQIDYIFGCGIISCQDDVNVAWINKTELTEDVLFGLNTNTTIVCDHGTLISKRLSVNSEYGDSRVAFNVYNGRKKLYYYTCYGNNLTVPIDTVFASCVELQFM
ncbi:TPA: BppU family phage baseplate upper protein [Enterococcus faecium]